MLTIKLPKFIKYAFRVKKGKIFNINCSIETSYVMFQKKCISYF